MDKPWSGAGEVVGCVGGVLLLYEVRCVRGSNRDGCVVGEGWYYGRVQLRNGQVEFEASGRYSYRLELW